jgi:hypothetical protein
MDAIVVSTGATPPSGIGVKLNDFLADSFWEPHANPRLVGRDLGSQEKVLRAICTHSDWLVVRLPQIRAGSDDEIVTLKQIVKMSTSMPSGFPITAIDIHIQSQRNISDETIQSFVASEMQRFVRSGAEIRLTQWPTGHILNRELIGGDFVRESSGERKEKARWYVTMAHVAVGGRRDPAETVSGGNSWCVYGRRQAHQRLEDIKHQQPVSSAIL